MQATRTLTTQPLLIITALLLAIAPRVDAGDADNINHKEVNIPLRNLYFGDIHVHTSLDIDSHMGYNTNDINDAYRFAKGEVSLPIAQAAPNPPNVSLKISKPLDFVAVTPHAEMMADSLCLDKKYLLLRPRIYFSESCQGIRNFHAKALYKEEEALASPRPHPPEDICPPVKNAPDATNPICIEATKNRWKDVQEIANSHYKKGTFTTFIAYEYTPHTSTGGAFHRNVIFRNNFVPDTVLTAYSAFTASILWEKLDKTCNTENNCQAVTIPHMCNLSDGMFFAREDRMDSSFAPKKYTTEDYERRKRLEPLIEIHQSKGSSECLTGAGTIDEFCNFESAVLSHCKSDKFANYSDVNCREDSYVRNGLKKGLIVKTKTGANPFKYGFIAGTDNQNGTPGATEEYQYMSQGGVVGATPKGRLTQQPKSNSPPLRAYNPGGLTGVWALENSRDAIFDAFLRKEVFGTSGTRISVRFFAGWNYAKDLHQHPRQNMIQTAYQNGTPMGGDLSHQNNIPNQQSPSFLVLASKDPMGANLQRLQVIKGWADNNGSHEQVYDIACSDGLEPDSNYRCPNNGATVDLTTCNDSESNGVSEFKVLWEDPDFNQSQDAFYYVRVLENPTCRWSTYDANSLKIEPLEDVPSTIQERAWSSPIWYTPSDRTANL